MYEQAVSLLCIISTHQEWHIKIALFHSYWLQVCLFFLFQTNKVRREEIPASIQSQKLLKDLSKEIRHAERYLNSLNPPKPERESKRKKRKPINKDFVDFSQPEDLEEPVSTSHLCRTLFMRWLCCQMLVIESVYWMHFACGEATIELSNSEAQWSLHEASPLV